MHNNILILPVKSNKLCTTFWIKLLPLSKQCFFHCSIFSLFGRELKSFKVRLEQPEQGYMLQPFGSSHGSALLSSSRPNSLSQPIIPTIIDIEACLKGLPRKTKSKAEANEEDNALRHRIAERHRRRRICQQYDMLRAALPNLIKRDKASVLGEAIKQLRELKKRVKETKAVFHGSLERVLPRELDKFCWSYCDNDGSLVKVTFSCDDRADLVSELSRAVRAVNGRVVRAEMVFIGGRNKSVMWVKVLSGNEGMLRIALKMALERPKMKMGKRIRRPILP